MRITILGASGGTGRELVKQALAGGHEVTAFVRTPAKLTITHPALLVLQGNVGDASAVSNAVAGRDAVLSCLGVGTPLKHDPVVIAGIRHVVSAMSAMPASRRLIYQSFIGVRDSRAAAGWLIRNVARFPLRHEIADHEAKEAIVQASALDWTIVRAPKLTDGEHTGNYRDGRDISTQAFFPTLSRADVAEFMLRQLENSAWLRSVVRLLPKVST